MVFKKLVLINKCCFFNMGLLKSQIAKLKSQINSNDQNSQSQIVIWILSFDSFDLEALDRLAQDGELVEPFVIWNLDF